MIELVAATEELDKDSVDKFELADRMALYVGFVIRIKFLQTSNTFEFTHFGKLNSVKVVKNNQSNDFGVWLEGDSTVISIDLTNEISILIDGSWKVIHRGDFKV